MRFYCPKCDLKYRIEGDKLTAQPNAQLRCNACHTVFGVQSAVKLAQHRVADGRVAVDGKPNLSLPPPKPTPVSFKPTDPVVASPGKGVVTLPLLDVTARPRNESLKQLNEKGGLTTPSLVPRLGTLNIGPKITRRSTGARAPLTAKGLRPTYDPVPLASKLKAKTAPEPLDSVEPPRPAHVSGRGSTRAFAPLTQDRANPAVPLLPLNRAALGATEVEPEAPSQPAPPSRPHSGPPSRPARSRPAPSSLPIPGRRISGPPVAVGVERVEVFEPLEELDEELISVEAEAPTTPVVAADTSSPLDTADEVYPLPDGAPSGEGGSVEPSAAPSPPTVENAASDAWAEPSMIERPMPSSVRLAVGRERTAPVFMPMDAEPPFVTKRTGISLMKAVTVALVASVVGFGAGYALGTKSEQSARHASLVTHEGERVARVDIPPPPEAQSSEQVAAEGATRAELDQPHPGTVDPTARMTTRASKTVGASPGAHDTIVSALGTLEGSVDGPAVRATETPSTKGAALGARAIQATVKRFQPGIKRSCWQPQLNRRGTDAVGTARVSTTVTVAPTGWVVSVSPEGDPTGYPGLATCIAGRVKTWKFPRAATETTVVIPFVFAAQ